MRTTKTGEQSSGSALRSDARAVSKVGMLMLWQRRASALAWACDVYIAKQVSSNVD